MSANGVNGNGKCVENQGQHLTWELGLVNSAGKYLTAEPFGFKLNVSATSLKKRQLWTIVPQSNGDHFHLISHLNRYFSSDKDGRVSCEVEEPGTDEQFAIEYDDKGSGKWAFKSVAYGYYFSGSEDNLSCFSKTPVWWSVHLAVHPQVHMQNQKRLRYIRLHNDELQGDQIIPWGYDSLVTLQYTKSGKIAVCTRDNRYLRCDGSLSEKLGNDESLLYALEVHCNNGETFAAFRDKEGKYLTLIGNTATLKSKNKVVGKDEMFSLEVSFPQIGLKSCQNGKFASIKQGVDLYANQVDSEETEIFQLEFVGGTETLWRLRANNNKYWTLATQNNGIKATSSSTKTDDANTLFKITNLASGQITLSNKANGMLVGAKKLGLMTATVNSSESDESCLFWPILLNRPVLILKGSFGLVGVRNKRLDCSMSSYEAFNLIHQDCGSYQLSDSSGQLFWTLIGGSQISLEPLSSTGGQQNFNVQLISGTHLAICPANSNCGYLRGEQNGPVKADAAELNSNCLWEF